jgi:hypothetical protein
MMEGGDDKKTDTKAQRIGNMICGKVWMLTGHNGGRLLCRVRSWLRRKRPPARVAF